MSFFGSIVEGITGFLGTSSGSAVIQAAAQVGGVILSSRANTDAAKQASRVAAESTAARETSQRAAQARFADIQEQTAPGVSHLRSVAGTDPAALTPQQQISLDDLRRDTDARFAASGLRGAGRSVVAGIRDVDARFMANALAQNQQRQDTAAGTLAGESFRAQTSAADLEAGVGGIRGAGITGSATPKIAAGLANTQLTGEAIGALGSLFQSELKERGRPSRFEDDDARKRE